MASIGLKMIVYRQTAQEDKHFMVHRNKRGKCLLKTGPLWVEL